MWRNSKGVIGRYIAKVSYGWDDKKFENEYLKKWER